MSTKSRPEISGLPALRPGQLACIEANQLSPVLIVGMHNSGTSILAEILHKSGVFLGNNMSHYESYFFSVFINDRLVMGGDQSWASLPLMSIQDVMLYRDTVGPFITKHWIADYLQCGYDGVSMWGIKDPRLCVLLPLYLDIFPDAKVVHIRRNPDDVAASLCRRKKHGVGKLDDFEHWKQLSLDYTDRVIEYSGKASAYFELEYEAFCRQSESVMRELFAFLGLPFTSETQALLTKVTPSRIGSYEKYQKGGCERFPTVARRLFGKTR
jgi:hypothetical protein